MCTPRQADFSLAKKREYRAQPYIVLPVAVGTWALVHRARNIPVFRKNHCWAFGGHLGILGTKMPICAQCAQCIHWIHNSHDISYLND